MKYGDTLQQRSIPLWDSYNIDYNDIKHLIKVRTTQGQGQARAIPNGQNEAEALHAFEDELFNELKDQHQRIDLFVRSKSGEIARRLAHLDRQIAQLGIKSSISSQGKISVRRLERYSRAEEATLKAGEDVQSLSRFVGAQRLAFQKLLKKYKKWTGSADLGNRFREELLDRPTSFSKQKFEPLLAQWSEVLTSVRAPFPTGVQWQTGKELHGKSRNGSRDLGGEASEQNKDSGSAAGLYSAWESGSNVEIDTALAILPLGRGAIKATYWVHPDNIVQVHVLLLQYTRLQTSGDSLQLPSSSTSSVLSRPGSTTNLNGKAATRTDEEICCIICDDLQRFAKRRSSETIGASEDAPGSLPEKAAASIRYLSSTGEAIVAVNKFVEANSKSTQSHRLKTTKVKRKSLRQMFQSSDGDSSSKTSASQESQEISEWIIAHQEVQPLVKWEAKRSRFHGLQNTESGGAWATLDKDILMCRCSRDQVSTGQGIDGISADGHDDCESFPHAILEVRIEGITSKELMVALDSSHLTERVRGFSLETHAVATLCKPHGMPRPFWLPALRQDIRKIPTAQKATNKRISQGRASPEEASTRHTSISASSTTQRPGSSSFSLAPGESSATSAPEPPVMCPAGASKGKRRFSQRRKSIRKRLAETSREQRYWNEFDDGSEASEDEAYTIFVDPNTSYSLLGAAKITQFFSSLSSNITASKAKISAWLSPSSYSAAKERQSLLHGPRSPSIDVTDSDEESSPTHRRHYSTTSSTSRPPAVRARETLLFRSCVASFAASVVVLIIAAILEATGRRKAEMVVDAGVIVGVAASLVFAIIGMGSMFGRKDDVGWVHRTLVLLLFLCIVLGSGSLIAALGYVSKKR